VKFNYTVNGIQHTFTLEQTAGGYQMTLGEQTYQIEDVRLTAGRVEFKFEGRRLQADWAAESPRKRWVSVEGKTHIVSKAAAQRRRGEEGVAGENQVCAPMPGQVREVLVNAGDQVTQGQLLILLEAMKMEIRILSPRAGTIGQLPVSTGEQVDKDALLVEITDSKS